MHFRDSCGNKVEVGTIVSFNEESPLDEKFGAFSYVVEEFLPESYEIKIRRISDPYDEKSVISGIDPMIVNSWEIGAI